MEPSANQPTQAPQSYPTPPQQPYAAPVQSEEPRGVFTGRLSRIGYLVACAYWTLGPIILVVISIGIVMIGDSISSGGNAAVNIFAYLVGAVAIIALIIGTIYSYGFLIRRLHDINQSGWLVLLTLVPFVGSLLPIVMLFIPGTVGPNQYGYGPQKSLGFREVTGYKRK